MARLVDAACVSGTREGAHRMTTQDRPRHRLAGPTAVGTTNTRVVASVVLLIAVVGIALLVF